jgi:hypothetical protein
MFGTVNNVTFRNNLVTNASNGAVDFITNGQLVGCTGGAGQIAPIGVPTNSAITGNSISGGDDFELILVQGSNNITVSNNSLSSATAFEIILLRIVIHTCQTTR